MTVVKLPNEASVIKRVSDILNLFSETSPTITLDDVEAVLHVSQATAYRYLHDLQEIGLLSRVSGHYTPGPTIMELEFLFANFDPILLAAKDVMDKLSSTLGVHMFLSRMYQDRSVNVYSSRPKYSQEMPLRPGRRLPAFRGAQARIALAYLDRRRQRRIFNRATDDPDRSIVGADWETFSAALKKNQQDGYYISRGEIEDFLIGIGAPVFDENGDIMGAISLSYYLSKPPKVRETKLIEVAKQTALHISNRVAEAAGGKSSEAAVE